MDNNLEMEGVSENYWSVQRKLTPFLELQDKSKDDMLPRYTGDTQRQLLELQQLDKGEDDMLIINVATLATQRGNSRTFGRQNRDRTTCQLGVLPTVLHALSYGQDISFACTEFYFSKIMCHGGLTWRNCVICLV
jgi:hypothetical protein